MIEIIVALIIVGVILWAINSFIPMDGKVKQILNVVVIIGILIWLLKAFGLLSKIPNP